MPQHDYTHFLPLETSDRETPPTAWARDAKLNTEKQGNNRGWHKSVTSTRILARAHKGGAKADQKAGWHSKCVTSTGTHKGGQQAGTSASGTQTGNKTGCEHKECGTSTRSELHGQGECEHKEWPVVPWCDQLHHQLRQGRFSYFRALKRSPCTSG